MESRESKVDIRRFIKILRNITLTVQIAPFIYSALYIAVLGVYQSADENTLSILDTLFYVSPMIVAVHLVYSKILRLCAWHKTACALPVIPQVFTLIDYYVVSFSEVEAYAFNIMIISMAVLLLFAAYKVFFSNGH